MKSGDMTLSSIHQLQSTETSGYLHVDWLE